jgi:signal transduction histidine kinase
MPSLLFQELALSQLELLASSVLIDNAAGDNDSRSEEYATSEDENASSNTPSGIAAYGSKIKSMAVYLPQENSLTGQLEFLPAVLYPHPKKERVFIANDSDSGMAPEIPKLLTKLPGFAHATSLIPRYPMLSKPPDEQNEATSAGVGVVEEVLCDVKSGGTALSVPLLAGSQTVGVLLVSPDQSKHHKHHKGGSIWTDYDRQQVARAAKSLSLALSMDTERLNARLQNHQVREALSDSLHQFKNPLQALRTYGKLLQRRMATNPNDDGATAAALTPQTLELAQHLLVQSDRIVERLKPVDAIVDAMRHESSESLQRSLHQGRLLALNPVEAKALVPWSDRRTTKTTKNPLVRPDWVAAQQAVWEPINVTDSFRSSSSGAVARDDIVSRSATPTGAADNAMPGAWYETSSQRQAMTSSTSPSSSNVQSNALLGDVRLEMSFIPDVLDPVWAIFRDIATDREILFTVQEEDELPGVMIWPLALQEAVINLLDNAFKYVVLSASPPEQRPRVRVRLLPNNAPANRHRPTRDGLSSPAPISPGVTMLIEDNGPGIQRHEQDAVFERGYRSESTAHVADGSGIGLAIALSLIEQMGGTLRVVDSDDYKDCLSGAVLELVVFRKPNVA